MKYYAIKDETKKEIVTDWQTCQEKLKEYNKPKFKSFSSLDDANAFLNDEENKINLDEPFAYIDGSFDKETEKYSFGGILVINNVEYKYKKGFLKDEYSQFRNVAGEIKGAAYIINHAINLGIKKLHIFYDYEGIEKWYTFKWKANTKIALEYQEFSKKVSEKIEVIFHKVKSHTNVYYNEIADKLAKEGLETV